MRNASMIGMIAASGLVIGLVAGRNLVTRDAPEKGAASSGTPHQMTIRGSGRSPSPAASPKHKNDLALLMRIVRNVSDSGDPDIIRELERLDTRDLRSLIEDLISSRPRHYSEEGEAFDLLLKTAVRVWYRRDGVEALQLAERLDDVDARLMLLSELINTAALETPELAKQWADRFREENGNDWYRAMIMHALQGAASRSTRDFIGVIELFRHEQANLSGYAYGHGPLAEDFDFSAAITAIPFRQGADHLMSRWAAKDPQAAWAMAKQLVAEHDDQAGTYVGNVFHGVSIMKGDAEAAEWLAAHIGEIPEASRRSAFESLWIQEDLSSERAATILSALSTRHDRITFTSVLLNPHGDAGPGLSALRALDSDASRAEALLTTAKTYAPGMGDPAGNHSKTVHAYFDSTMEKLALHASTREAIRTALSPHHN